MRKPNKVLIRSKINIINDSYDLEIEDKFKMFKRNEIDCILLDNELIVMFTASLMNSLGNGMWKGRASCFLVSFLTPLLDLVKKYKLKITPSLISNNIGREGLVVVLNELEKQDMQIPFKLKEYLSNLPNYNSAISINNQEETVYIQHGYISMQLTHVLNLLNDRFDYNKSNITFNQLAILNKLNSF
jgi:hypothetical protein